MISKVTFGFSLLLCVGTYPVLADLTPILITRQVDANGSIALCGPDSCLTSESFDASDTSNALGLFDVIRSGSDADISGSAQQTSNVTSNAITIDMQTASTVSGVPQPSIGQSDASSKFSLVFTVDALSKVQIGGTASLNFDSGLIEEFGSPGFGGTQSVTLLGPGVNFAPSTPGLSGGFGSNCFLPPIGGPCDSGQTVPISSTLTLAPGQYTLEVSTDAGLSDEGDALGEISGSSDLSLVVAFPGATVPEPLMVPVLLLLLAGLVQYRRAYVRETS
jgi:hypothetical protein